ncbi:MAG: PH domain-containing protein [Ruminococcus sp.]|nr:PH domain-containing protein [Ruminococcus sp.]
MIFGNMIFGTGNPSPTVERKPSLYKIAGLAGAFLPIIALGDVMEELPSKAKAVVGIYGAAATLAQTSAAFFGFDREDFIVILVSLFIAGAVGSYVYIVLFFRHYRYFISDGVIIIKKGALFKRRHLIYIDRISTITIHESFVHRWFKLCTIYFHAQGSVVRLSFVPIEKSDKLQEILDSRNRFVSS